MKAILQQDREKMESTGLDQFLSDWVPQVRTQGNEEAQVIDLFSGCGGMSLGFSAVSQAFGTYRLVGAVDINEHSLATYHRNFGVPAINRDVKDLAYSDGELNKMLSSLDDFDAKKPLVLIGCAPCQGFSSHRKKSWDKQDERNGLVDAFAEVAAALKPECIIMENVPELLSGRYWPHFEAFQKRLECEGYTVKQTIHNSAAYGTPQERFRALVIAMRRSDFLMPENYLEPEDFRTVRDAIGDLTPVDAGQAPRNDPMHKSAGHRKSTIDVIRAVPKDGGSRPSGIGPKCLDRVKGYYDVYGRLAWNKPSITITHYARNPASGRFIHPDQDRGLTMREAARLQGFPDRFSFEGCFDDVFRQIGEAVPPHFSTAIALCMRDNLKGKSATSDQNLTQQPVSDSYSSVIAGIKMNRNR